MTPTPEWAIAEADRILIDEGLSVELEHEMRDSIALAVQAAHARGIEQAAALCDERAAVRSQQRHDQPHQHGESNRTRDRLAARRLEDLALAARIRALLTPKATP